MRPRARPAGVAGAAVLVSLPLVIVALALHASYARKTRDSRASSIAEVAARVPSNDLALSGGARWLRTPSLEEPGAAFADGPALPDPDPAGGAMAPPRAVWAASSPERGAAK